MGLTWLRSYCISMPHATESVQWGDNLVFKIGGKIFAIVALEPQAVLVSLKVTLEEFGELTERQGIIPAPYLARYHWISIETEEALPAPELKQLLKRSYELVRDKLPRKTRLALI